MSRTRRRLLVAGGLVTAALAALAIAIHRPYPLARLSPGEATSLRILARGGEVLREVPLRGGGRSQWVSLDRVAPLVILATVAAEDEHFFEHHGVDWRGLLRAGWLDARAGRFAYGGSTVTMQLSRMVQRHSRTPWGKAAEIVDALRLDRTLDKRAILEQYLNRAYYGHGAWGIAAAAQRYFGKPADALSAGEATLLAILPRGPLAYDPEAHLARALERRDHVLGLLERRGLIDAATRAGAVQQPLALRHEPPPERAPHFVDWVLEGLSPAQRQRSGDVRTTLDWRLQQLVEQRVAEHLADHPNLHDAGLVVVAPHTGEVLALVGSRDYRAAAAGQLDIATTRRSPGSALKPFIYALALEAGRSPSSLAVDLRQAGDRPVHHRDHEHGYARYREALGGSFNFAAVHLLQEVGTEAFLERLVRAGVLRSEDNDCRRLPIERLALGGCTVRLVDLAASYSFLVEGGEVHPACAQRPCPAARPLYSPGASFLVLDMLADNEARRAVFGNDLPLDLPFPVAAKTGTAAGFSDTVALGVTREAIVAAWTGDVSGQGTRGALAMWSAAPLVRAGLLAVADGRTLTLPAPPATVESLAVCAVSGALPGPSCPTKREYVVRGHGPHEQCPGHPAGRAVAD